VDSHNNQEFLGVDVGSARIGIARGATAARLAEPLKTVPAAQALAELKKTAAQNGAAGIVVGLPRSLDGTETAQTELVRQWAELAKRELNLAFYWQDEALTSQAAGKIQSSKIKHQTADEHSLAAAIILQDFLDTAESDRVAV
jgi:putative Holliday junction resolvase